LVAAVDVELHDLDYRPEKTVLPLESALIFGEEPVEMMEKHPVEDGPLRMSGIPLRCPAYRPTVFRSRLPGVLLAFHPLNLEHMSPSVKGRWKRKGVLRYDGLKPQGGSP